MTGDRERVLDLKKLETQPFMTDAPEMWKGPSLLVRSRPGQMTSTGYTLKQLTWENRIPVPRQPVEAKHLAEFVGEQFASDVTEAESWEVESIARPVVDTTNLRFVEVVCGDSDVDESIHGIGVTLFGEEMWARIRALPKPGETSPTRNRPVTADLPGGSGDVEPELQVIDLRLSTAPNTHGSGTLQFATRWVRLVASRSALFVWWFPLAGHSWDPEAVRWPHNGVPLHSEQGLIGIANASRVEDMLDVLINEFLGHIRYYQERWPDELDWWEKDLFGSITEGAGPLSGLELEKRTLIRLGKLSEFLNQSRADVRLLQRRLAADPLLCELSDIESRRMETKEVLELQAENENRRREAFGLLAALASGQQILNANEQRLAATAQRQATERLQSIVVWVSALLLAPSLVIGAFGANLSVLAEGTFGSVGQLISWALIAAGASSILLLAVQRPGSKKITMAWLALAVCAFLASLFWAISHWSEWLPKLVSVTWLGVILCALILFLVGQSRRTEADRS